MSSKSKKRSSPLDTTSKPHAAKRDRAEEVKEDASTSTSFSSFSADTFSASSMRAVSSAIGSSGALPSSKKGDWDFYCSFADFRRVMTAERDSLADLLSRLLRWNGLKTGGLDLASASAEDLCDLLTEANDEMLERIGMSVDEAAGLKKRAGQRAKDEEEQEGEGPELLEVSASKANQTRMLSGSWNNRPNPAVRKDASSSSAAEDFKLITAKNILRPQLAFKDLIDNSASSPFEPRIKEKPNARRPLSILPEYSPEGDGTEIESYTHPYLHELEVFAATSGGVSKGGENGEVPPATPVSEAKMVRVEMPEQLERMIEELKKEDEISVDLEAHWFRSYQGFTCLIQISTDEKDFIVDPFPLWRQLTSLNEIFTDPTIVKVFHGGDNDLVWLQRDFSVYVVNMFDTHQAAIRLNFPIGSRGYKSVLKHYCKVEVDKRFQLADWRVRPLPDGMLDYARTDARYLLHVARRMRRDLLGAANGRDNLLRATVDACTQMCTRKYEKPARVGVDGHMGLVRRSRSNPNSRQMRALREVFSWRDKVAREEDESTEFVLPNHMLLKICTELPREMQGILACCSPIPPLVRQNLQPLHLIILRARESPLESTAADLDIEQSKHRAHQDHTRRLLQADLAEDPLSTTLDLSRVADLENRAGEENEDGEALLRRLSIDGASSSSIGTIFDRSPSPTEKKKGKKKTKESPTFASPPAKTSFLSPYLRYKMLKPYLQHVKGREEGRGGNELDKHADQVRSIREHFEALTAMTAEEFAADSEKEAEKQGGESNGSGTEEREVVEAEEEVDAGPVKPLRAGMAISSAKNFAKKRKKQMKSAMSSGKTPKMEEAVERDPSSSMDYESADFGQFTGGGGKKKGKGNNGAAYDPWKGFDKKGGGGGKKQKFKAGGRSMSYK